MKKVKVNRLLIFSVCGILIFALICLFISKCIASDIFKKNSLEIRKDILILTPVGTDVENVVNVIEENDMFYWDRYINQEIGYMADEVGEEIVGKKSIRATIKKKTFPFNKSIVIFWGFDEESKLIDVMVKKELAGF